MERIERNFDGEIIDKSSISEACPYKTRSPLSYKPILYV